MKQTFQRLHDDCAWNMKIQNDKYLDSKFTRMNTLTKERCEYCGKLITHSHCGAQYKIEFSD